jgi:hypothetical protein
LFNSSFDFRNGFRWSIGVHGYHLLPLRSRKKAEKRGRESFLNPRSLFPTAGDRAGEA